MRRSPRAALAAAMLAACASTPQEQAPRRVEKHAPAAAQDGSDATWYVATVDGCWRLSSAFPPYQTPDEVARRARAIRGAGELRWSTVPDTTSSVALLYRQDMQDGRPIVFVQGFQACRHVVRMHRLAENLPPPLPQSPAETDWPWPD